MNVVITQPLLTRYRLPLFRRLAAMGEWDLQVLASRELPWVSNLRSVTIDESWANLDHPVRRLPGTPFAWQANMHLPASLGPGDVAVLFSELRYLSNYRLLVQGRRRRCGLIWWGHGRAKQGAVANRLRVLLARLCDVVLLYHDNEKEMYERSGFRSDCVFATQNALDQTPISESRAQWPDDRLRQFQQQEGISQQKVILYCGRFRDFDRLKLAIAAHKEILIHDSDCVLVFIGEGDCRPALEAFARRTCPPQSVRFLGPVYNHADLAPWFLSAHCFVFPRSLGLSVFDAFGYGLPVITHDYLPGHTPEISALRDGYNGLLFRDGDALDLARKVTMLIDNPSLRDQMSENAERTVAEEYNMDIMASRFCAAIRRASEISLARKARVRNSPAHESRAL